MAYRNLPPQHFLRECFDYNQNDGSLSWRTRPPHHFKTEFACLAWNGRNAGKRVTSLGSDGYVRVSIADLEKKQRWPAHRIIFKLMTGKDPADEIDHKNRIKTDNR
jgi:hypothetical protein